MTWGKMDDKFHRNRKVRELRRMKGGRQALGDWAFWWSWCLDDPELSGFVPSFELDPEDLKSAKLLVLVGLWDETDGGYLFHDFREYNPTREQREAKKSADRERIAVKRKASRDDVARDTDATSARFARESPPTRVPDPTRPDPNHTSPAGDVARVAALAAAPVERMLRSLTKPTKLDAEIVALVSATRKEAGGAPFRVTGHHDRDAVQRLGEWASDPAIGVSMLRAALVGFWAAKGTGARLSYLVEEDPGRFLGERKTGRQRGPVSASHDEHAAVVEAAGGKGRGYAVIEL